MAIEDEEGQEAKFVPSLSTTQPYLQNFRLYETQLKFYMVGRDKSRTYWRVLVIDRSEPYELNVRDDSTIYSERECSDLLRRIHEGNKSTGGLKFVTTCYGIVGFIRFLGPYYMLLITKRRQIGAICGHIVYAISKSEMIPIEISMVQSSMAINKDENRYKKILYMLDLTKDFFFSYSYDVMRALQKNLCDKQSGQTLYEAMCVWNEFLTRGIRNQVQNTLWTIALVYGFFKQVCYFCHHEDEDNQRSLISRLSVSALTCSVSFVSVWVIIPSVFLGRIGVIAAAICSHSVTGNHFSNVLSTLAAAGQDFRLTLIARRSRHYAGTRYLKRGVNEKGRVANDVETEQIVFEDVPEGSPVRISSIVQNRGSIPLFWSQETSRLNIKPDISMSRTDPNYEATRLHFENLVKRYGNPIIILNLIKTNEKKPRESILRAEFANAIEVINKDLAEENRLKFLHLDLNKHSRTKATNVLLLLGKVATYALTLTGSFHCQLHPSVVSGAPSSCPLSKNLLSSDNSVEKDIETVNEDACGVACDASINVNSSDKNPTLQKGVLRTNCIDCLDRTNVAQYAYGLAALGHQLHVLGMIDLPKIDLGAPLAEDLMAFYEKMGDILAHQYGGSAAHNKIFSERRGQWKAATQSQEFFRTLQRFYSNAYMDAEKQNAIDLFLGHFQPQQGKPAIWELGSDQDYKPERDGAGHTENEEGRTIFKRCWSDGNILRKSSSPSSATDAKQQKFPVMVHLESSSDISASESDVSYSRNYCHLTSKQLFGDETREPSPENCLDIHERMDSSDCSNFVDLDWLSSSEHSCEDLIDRAMLMNSSSAGLSLENVGVVGSEYGSCLMGNEQLETGLSRANGSTLDDYSDTFADWVTHGEALCLRSS